jgi:DDE domain
MHQGPGRWRYLHRAVDASGALVDVMPSERRDLAAANAFFRSALKVAGAPPDRVTTDGIAKLTVPGRAELVGWHLSPPPTPATASRPRSSSMRCGRTTCSVRVCEMSS